LNMNKLESLLFLIAAGDGSPAKQALTGPVL
jgi:hypothetical protein